MRQKTTAMDDVIINAHATANSKLGFYTAFDIFLERKIYVGDLSNCLQFKINIVISAASLVYINNIFEELKLLTRKMYFGDHSSCRQATLVFIIFILK